MNKKTRKVTKFVDEYSYDFTSSDKVYNYYSHMSHRSNIYMTMVSNLDDERMHSSIISCVVIVINPREDDKHDTQSVLII